MKVYGVIDDEKREPTEEEAREMTKRLMKTAGKIFFDAEVTFEEPEGKATA